MSRPQHRLDVHDRDEAISIPPKHQATRWSGIRRTIHKLSVDADRIRTYNGCYRRMHHYYGSHTLSNACIASFESDRSPGASIPFILSSSCA